jgi:hypothetical protein
MHTPVGTEHCLGRELRHRQLRQHRLGQQYRWGESIDSDNIVWGNTDGDNIVGQQQRRQHVCIGTDDNIVGATSTKITSCGATTEAAPTAITSFGATADDNIVRQRRGSR